MKASRIWFHIWLVLLALYLVTAITGRIYGFPRRNAVLPGGEDLLELAEETNRVWRANEIAQDPPADPEPAVRTEPLLERAEWMLQLREAQTRLVDRGTDVRLVDDLAEWMDLHSTALGPEADALNLYLAQLMTWMESHLTGDPEARLERIRLEPTVHSSFPALYFEMSGSPLQMGRRLIGLSGGQTQWCLRSLDLVQAESGGPWWLQARCSLLPGVEG